MADEPRFSIGITTYHRLAMLRECVDSVLRQTRGDFEVLIGNDAPDDPITLERLGTDDERVRIINHPVNLGEHGNMNALLAASTGRYFTWQADDDFYAPTYLEEIAAAQDRNPKADAVFCGFLVLRSTAIPNELLRRRPPSVPPRTYDGAAFLQDYWRGKIRTMSLVAMFDVTFLRRLGGITAMTDIPIAALSEYYLVLQVAAASRQVAYVASPLVYYRAHETSWSTSNSRVDAVEVAGINLISRGADLLRARMITGAEPVLGRVTRLALLTTTRMLARQGGLFPVRRSVRYLARCIRAEIKGSQRRINSYIAAARVVGVYSFVLLPTAVFLSCAPGWLRRALLEFRDRRVGGAAHYRAAATKI